MKNRWAEFLNQLFSNSLVLTDDEVQWVSVTFASGRHEPFTLRTIIFHGEHYATRSLILVSLKALSSKLQHCKVLPWSAMSDGMQVINQENQQNIE